jgi:hypothetical protein
MRELGLRHLQREQGDGPAVLDGGILHDVGSQGAVVHHDVVGDEVLVSRHRQIERLAFPDRLDRDDLVPPQIGCCEVHHRRLGDRLRDLRE